MSHISCEDYYEREAVTLNNYHEITTNYYTLLKGRIVMDGIKEQEIIVGWNIRATARDIISILVRSFQHSIVTSQWSAG